MNLTQIEYVFAVAEHLNFTAASKSLHISQPALSMQIKQLEEELGVELFNRDTRFVSLTPAGSLFLSEFHTLLGDIEVSLDKIRQLGEKRTDTLNIGFPEGIHYFSFLPPILKMFSKQYPDTTVKLTRHTISELEKKLRNGDLDIIFTFSFDKVIVQEMQFIRIEKRRPYVIVSKSSHLAEKDSIDARDLRNETFITINPDFLPGSDVRNSETWDSLGVLPVETIYADNNENMISLVELNEGVTFMDRSVCLDHHLKCFDVIGQEFSYFLICAWHRSNTRDPRIAFSEAIERYSRNCEGEEVN